MDITKTDSKTRRFSLRTSMNSVKSFDSREIFSNRIVRIKRVVRHKLKALLITVKAGRIENKSIMAIGLNG